MLCYLHHSLASVATWPKLKAFFQASEYMPDRQKSQKWMGYPTTHILQTHSYSVESSSKLSDPVPCQSNNLM